MPVYELNKALDACKIDKGGRVYVISDLWEVGWLDSPNTGV